MTTFTVPDFKLDAAMVERLKQYDSPTVANAIETFKVRDRTEGYIGGYVRALYDAGVMVGQALTVTIGQKPGKVAGRDGYWAMWEALERMSSPAVIVMQDVTGTPERYACAGEVMATLAKRLGAVGMVADGGLRDIAEVQALGFHYYAAFPVVSHGNFEILDVGVPVEIDGQVVHTGDILHGDINGIVIIPNDVLDGLEDAIKVIRDREARFMNFIKGENFTLEAARAGTGY
ncbi:MAG TPA: RraA family protein [Thermomicrobiales bacterium]|nr:RraA family protein [Thermomicrobiales bacterium]